MTAKKSVRLALAFLACTALFLAIVSLFPEHFGLYTSAWAVALWGATAFVAVIGLCKAKLWKRPAVFALHCSLLVVLAGALVTHIFGKTDSLHLRVGEHAVVFGNKVALNDFKVEYYPATSVPADFIAYVSVGDSVPAQISMNRTADVNGMRIFIASCDSDRQGCRLTIAKDAAGTAVSYAGYLLLLLAMCLISLKPRRVSAAVCALLVGLCANASPKVIPRPLADELGNLFVCHNDRVAPLSTLARDFSLKIYGTDHYHGYTPEQVMSGWLFFYNDWKIDSGIKIKDKKARELMGIDGKRCSLKNFFGQEGYLFDDPQYAEANEKFALISSVAAGSIWKLFPFREDTLIANPSVAWYSPVDETPAQMSLDDWRMTRHSLGYLAELISKGDWERARSVIAKIGKYQQIKCGDSLPAAGKVKAERIFLKLSGSPLPVIIFIICGIALLLFPHKTIGLVLSATGALWVLALICLNGYASGHLPMANGYETMQWMALFSLAFGLCMGAKHASMLPIGLIVAAMALAVALMGQSNPQLTNLMPVLRSPLLSVHVLAMMMAYALLASIALISALWLMGRGGLLPVARRLLRPAVFLLAFGIFIGAVWANMSWGRYWGWDPKETWALVTMLIYSIPLHHASLPAFCRDRVFAIYALAAFATVLMTYFGVNFLLGGLHSYA